MKPNLFRNTTPIAPYEGKPNWNLITAMADDAIGHIKMLNETTPDRPFCIGDLAIASLEGVFGEQQPRGVKELHSPTRRGQVRVFGQGLGLKTTLGDRKTDQTTDFAVLLPRDAT